ncbi:MAG: hypothetical protein R3A44_44235 [Caldilineaceae bacterium]
MNQAKQPDPNRSAGGKFAKGNTISSKGGQARAAKLGKRRRRQIAKQGFQALVDKRFNGNRQLAKNWVVARALSKMGSLEDEIDFGFRSHI